MAKKTMKQAYREAGAIGVSYETAMVSGGILAPVTDHGLGIVQRQTNLASLPREMKTRILSMPYATNLAVVAADGFVNHKFHQTSALSRGSLTAWAPEVFQGLKAIQYARTTRRVRDVHRLTSLLRNGYDPLANRSNLHHPDFVTYRAIKHAGQGLRWANTHIKVVGRFLRPIQRIVSALGGAI